MAQLTPYPFSSLVRRALRELERNDAVFDLPRARFFPGDPAHDLSVRFHGHRASSPLGPAAGPHTQMAQNIVLAWLAGSRILELKTVQVLDELEVPRPCIDMRTIGLNAEWSQELKLPQSRDEYVKASMLIDILRAQGAVPLEDGFGDTLFDLSVGYDLKGIQSESVSAFLRDMKDARETVDRLRKELPPEARKFRDLDFRTALSDTVTLSTFHGCPPEEIERIIEYLMREHGLHCVVKFNPMLLGPDETRRLLHDELGYTDVRIPDGAFERDTKWEQAVDFMDRLGGIADELGLTLGAKFTNTLIVENTSSFLPDSEKEVYLSGSPLHVLAMHLVRRFRGRFGDRFPVSFAAGIDRANFPDAVALGLTPITVCSDLLKPQGYGRLPAYYKELARRMNEVGAADVDDFVLRAYGGAEDALDRCNPDPGTRRRCLHALAEGGNLREAAGGELFARWVSEARLGNTEHYVPRTVESGRYAAARHSKPPMKIGRRLKLFDCLSCDKCIPVCPNDANFAFVPPESEIPIVTLHRDGGGWKWVREGAIALEESHQIGNFADFCNECGNCDVFCPEDGGPYALKPRFFGSRRSWEAFRDRDGFHLHRDAEGDTVLGRLDGSEYRLTVAGGKMEFVGAGFRIAFLESDPAGTVSGEGPETVDLTPCFIMDSLRRGVLDSPQINYVNAPLEGNLVP